MRPAGALAVAVVLLSAVTGCSTSGDAPPSSTPPTSTQRPSGPNDVDADLPSPLAYPSDDAASRAGAQAVAGAAMAAFIRIDADADTWLAGLSAHLTPTARADYVGTDPLEVPARALVGAARYDGSTSAYLATVIVPTDVGDYRLLLAREGQGAPWLVETLTPPDGLP